MKEKEKFLRQIKYIFDHIYLKIMVANKFNKIKKLIFLALQIIILAQNTRLIASNDICIIIMQLKISVRQFFFFK